MQNEYKVIIADSVGKLERAVNEAMGNDRPWQVTGGVTVIQTRESITMYQAMFRFSKTTIAIHGDRKANIPAAAGNANSTSGKK